jgi:hypothetical protein
MPQRGVGQPLLASDAAQPKAAAKTKDEWTPDSEQRACTDCEKPFTIKRRRHHCRACGGMFCADCCSSKSKRVMATDRVGGKEKERRVCKLCWHSISLLSDGIEQGSVLDLATRDEPSPPPTEVVAVLIQLGTRGSQDVMSGISRKLSERLQDDSVHVKLRAVRVLKMLLDGVEEAHRKGGGGGGGQGGDSRTLLAMVKHDALAAVRALTRYTCAPDPVHGAEPAASLREAAMELRRALESLPDVAEVIGRPALEPRGDARSVTVGCRPLPPLPPHPSVCCFSLGYLSATSVLACAGASRS